MSKTFHQLTREALDVLDARMHSHNGDVQIDAVERILKIWEVLSTTENPWVPKQWTAEDE